MHHGNRSRIWDICLGAFAGVVAAWSMTQATNFIGERQSERVRRQEEAALRRHVADDRAAGPAYGGTEQRATAGLSSGGSIAIEKVARAAGQEFSHEQREASVLALQAAMGMAAGATYALLRPRAGGVRWGLGLGFGTAFWLLVDEVGNPVLGLTPPPGEFPWQVHVRGLVGHLVLGGTLELTLASMTLLRGDGDASCAPDASNPRCVP